MLNQIVSIIEKADPVDETEQFCEEDLLLDDEFCKQERKCSPSPNSQTDMIAVNINDIQREDCPVKIESSPVSLQSPILDNCEATPDDKPKSETITPLKTISSVESHDPFFKKITDEAASDAYRCKLVELQELICNFKKFKTMTIGCLQSYQSEMDKLGRGEITDGLLSEMENHTLPNTEKSLSEINAHFHCIEQEIRKEAVGDRALETLCGYLQGNVRQLESQVTILNEEKHRLLENEQRLLSETSTTIPVQNHSDGGEAEQKKMRRKLDKAQSESSEKQAMISVLYTEKEDLRHRLEMCEARLETVAATPQAKVNDSHFFQSIAGRGQLGLRVTAAVTRIDYYTLRLGKVAYSNAVVRVLIAVYLIIIHLWVFYVISSSVHMLPSLAESVHDHEMHFNNNH